MNITGIIPARFGSTRFPGKPLADIGGKTLIRRVYEQVSKTLDSVFVATDDKRIADEVRSFGGEVIITSPDHKSGTDRCAEALRYIRKERSVFPDVVINIQGDEPFIYPDQINQLSSLFMDNSVEIATLIKEISSQDELDDINKPKVIISNNGDALYFSRSVIPFIRDIKQSDWLISNTFYKHIGIYAYRPDTLLLISDLPPSSLEMAESLEQVRWLQNGLKIRTAITNLESIGIDTPADLENAKVLLKEL